MPHDKRALARDNSKDKSLPDSANRNDGLLSATKGEPEPGAARTTAMKMINGMIRSDSSVIFGFDKQLYGPEAVGGAAYLQELKKIMFEGTGDVPVIAAFLRLINDIEDRSAVRVMKNAIEKGDFDRSGTAVLLCGRLSNVPTPLIPGLVELLQGDDVRLVIGAALALRDTYPAALQILVRVLRGEDHRLRRFAASALGRVEESVRPDVRMDEIITALTGRLETLEDQEQFEAISLIYSMGPAAATAVPALVRLLTEPLVRPGTRTVIIHLLGKTGHKEETMIALMRALSHAIRSKNWINVISATESIAALGNAPAKAINELLTLLREPDKDSQICALKALRAFGPALEPVTETLINMVNRVNDNDVFEAWARTVGKIGPSAIHPLVQLLHARRVEVFGYAAAALQGIGAEGSAQFVNLLLTDPNKGTREFAAVFLNSCGKKAEMAVPAIVKVLEQEGGEKHVEAAVLALSRLGASARAAAPILAHFLVAGSEVTKELAAEGLINIGPEAIPSLRQAHEHADAEGKERIAEILGKWDFVIEKQPSGLERFGNDKMLATIATVLEILKKKGPISAANIAKELKVSREAIRIWLLKFEKRLTAYRGATVQLIDRQSTKAMGISKDGHEFLAELQAYLDRRKNNRNTKGA